MDPRIDQPAEAAALPATDRQLQFARVLATRNRVSLPEGVLGDRRTLSAWIDHQRAVAPRHPDPGPSSRQVAFAERLARIRRSTVPPECFRDRGLMSRWIDRHR